MPPPELGEAESDLIVELSLNGQQWSTDCKHLRVVLDPIPSAISPDTCALEGGATLRVAADHLVDTGVLKARFTKLPAAEEGVAPQLPTDAESLVVDAVLCEGGAEVEVSAP